MKAWVARSLTGPDSLELRDIAAPASPGPRQVRVRIRAASLNARDGMILGGAYAALTVADLIPASDGAGEVMEVGPDVWRVRPGDRVALTFYPDWIGGPWEPSPSMLGRGGSSQGVLREEIVVHQHELVGIPDHLSFEEAATLPCAAVTAWSALTLDAVPLPGEAVLVQGTGGVSVFALQLAKLFGQRVIVTSSSPEKLAFLKSLGADEVIDRAVTPAWDTEVRRLTDGVGVDRVIDVGGGATVARSFASVRPGGRVSLVGLLGGLPEQAPLLASAAHSGVVQVGNRADFVAMNRAIAFHRMKPVIHRVHPFEDAKLALRDFASQQHLGKVVIRVA